MMQDPIHKKLITEFTTSGTGKMVADINKITAATNKNTAANKANEQAVASNSKKSMSATKALATSNKNMSNSVSKSFYDVDTHWNGTVDNMLKGNKKIASTFGISNKSIDAFYSKMNRVRWAMVNFTFVAAGVAAVLAPFVLMVKYGGELQEAFQRVAKTTGLTTTEIATLRDEFVSLSRTMPNTVKELAEIGAVAGQLGIKKDDILDFTRSVSLISLTTDMAAKDTAASFAKLAAAFSIDIDNIINLGNILNELENTTAATADGLVASLLRAGNAATTLGISFETASAASATLVSAGMSAERSGTRLRNLFIKMSANADDFAKITGQSTAEFKQLLGRDADAALSLVVNGLKDASSNAEEVELAVAAAGRVGGTALLTLANNADAFNQNLEVTAEMANNSLSIVQEYLRLMKTAPKEAALLKNETLASVDDSVSYFTEKWRQALSDVRQDMRYFSVAKFGIKVAGGSSSPILEKLGLNLDVLSGKYKEDRDAINDYYSKIQQAIADGKITEAAFADTLTGVKELIDAGDLAGALGALQLAYEGIKDITADTTSNNLDLLDVYTDFPSAMAAYTAAASAVENYTGKDSKALSDLMENLENVKTGIEEGLADENALAAIIKLYNVTDSLASSTSAYNVALTGLNKQLSNYKEQLSDVNSSIATLKKPEFAGASAVENLIEDIQRFEKEQNLLAKGITDPYDFMMSAVKKADSGLGQFLDTVYEVNDATADSKDSYEAWKDTINEFISSSLEAGNSLSKNVSKTIGTYKSLLLSTTKFTNETDNQESSIDVLKDAYDVYYGKMQDNVDRAVDAHEKEGQTVYNSSGQVISALENQWMAQDRYATKVDDTSRMIDFLSDEMFMAQLAFDAYNAGIDSSITSLNDLTDAAIAAATAQARVSGSTSSSSSSGGSGGGNISRDVVDRLTGTSTRDDGQDLRSKYLSGSYNDFIWRAGQNPIAISPQDNIMGFKDSSKTADGGSSGGITIQNINISGASGDPADFAEKFAKELRRELRTI